VSGESLLRRAVLILVVLQLATVVLLAMLALRPQPNVPDVSGFVTTNDMQQLDSDLRQSISASCNAIVGAIPAGSPVLNWGGGPPTCP
jgi:hypothetical protein